MTKTELEKSFRVSHSKDTLADIVKAEKALNKIASLPVEGTVVEYTLKNGKKLLALHWDIGTNGRFYLTTSSGTLLAYTMEVSLDDVRWQAGGGWPTYRVGCPRGPNGLHRVKSYLGNREFTFCNFFTRTISGSTETRSVWGVTDDDHSDNSGYFSISIYSYN